MSTNAESDPDIGSKQALADTSRNLVRYETALRPSYHLGTASTSRFV